MIFQGIQFIDDHVLSPHPLYAGKIKSAELDDAFTKYEVEGTCTRLEKMFILSIAQALKGLDFDLTRSDTLLIICTTKGNIDLLESGHSLKYLKKGLYCSKCAPS